ALLGAATALLFPIDWPEPFGLVTIEVLSCGTPVVARPCGAVPEIVQDGVTGFLARETDDLVAAVRRAAELDRARCRSEFEARFSRERMVESYERIYAALAGRSDRETPRIRLAA